MRSAATRFTVPAATVLLVLLPAAVAANALMDTPVWVKEGDFDGAVAGSHFEFAGDINGDGFDDIMVERIRPGDVLFFYGSPRGLGSVPDWVFEPGSHGGTAANPDGISYVDLYVGRAGDVNGDGFGDVIIGEPGHHVPNTAGGQGRAWVFLGSASGIQTTAVWAVDGDIPEAGFGWWVGTAGDINGDGYDDILASAPFYSVPVPWSGAVYLFMGSPSGPSPTPAWVKNDVNQFNAILGRQVSTAGDVDADGYDDIIVSAPGYQNGEGAEGAVFLYYGSPTGLKPTGVTLEPDMVGASLGFALDTAGDVNGDGYSDILASAPGYSNGQAGEGAVYIFHGSATGLVTTPAKILEGTMAGLDFGKGAAAMGDVDGDGYDDIVAGSDDYPPWTGGLRGMARLHRGGPNGIATGINWTTYGETINDQYGSAVHGRGDFNGDGYDDVLVGAPGRQGNEFPYEGAVYVYSHCVQSDADTHCNVLDNCPEVDNETQTNGDGDWAGDACDCASGDAALWGPPGEVRLAVGAAGALSWTPHWDTGGTAAPVYDTLRSANQNFVGGTTCVESDGTDLQATDGAIPGSGLAHFYLVRPESACSTPGDSLGKSSLGVARSGRSCP